MSEQQPEYVWAFPPEKPKRGRVWLIVGLAVVAIAIVALLLWLFLRPAIPAPVPTSTTSASPSASASPTPAMSPAAEPTPTPPPATTPPPVPDPALSVFQGKVSPVLTDAQRGLQIVSESDPQEAAQNVGFLQEDAGRLAEVVAPSSIASRWSSGLDAYATSLQALRKAYEGGSAADRELSTAKSALQALSDIAAGR
jgi:cytoskeletal protein RodZ